MEQSKPLMLTIKRLEKEWSRYLRKVSVQIGMPDSYRRIIMYLSRNGGANQKQIAEFCQMTNAAISQTIKEMILSGYVIKESDMNDQRYYKLYLTDKGRENVEIIREKIYAADDFITKIVTPQKEAEIVDILTNLTEIIEKEM